MPEKTKRHFPWPSEMFTRPQVFGLSLPHMNRSFLLSAQFFQLATYIYKTFIDRYKCFRKAGIYFPKSPSRFSYRRDTIVTINVTPEGLKIAPFHEVASKIIILFVHLDLSSELQTSTIIWWRHHIIEWARFTPIYTFFLTDSLFFVCIDGSILSGLILDAFIFPWLEE